MTPPPRRSTPARLALASFVFASVHLAYESLNGGVQSHHLLNRPDLPAVSNGLGLVVLPALGWLLDLRLRTHPGLSGRVWGGFAGALLYGAVLAISFERGASAITSVLFLGLFVLAAARPIYRAEFVLGFVAGMTVTFGAVLPSLVAVVFAAVSAGVRFAFRAVAARAGFASRTSEGA